MIRRSLTVLGAVACLATAPAMAQQPNTPAPAQSTTGPRIEPGFHSYQPVLARKDAATATATTAVAAADRTVITISTLGLVLLAVLLILLLS